MLTSILGEIALMILLRQIGLHLHNSKVLLMSEVADPGYVDVKRPQHLHSKLHLLLYKYSGRHV